MRCIELGLVRLLCRAPSKYNHLPFAIDAPLCVSHRLELRSVSPWVPIPVCAAYSAAFSSTAPNPADRGVLLKRIAELSGVVRSLRSTDLITSPIFVMLTRIIFAGSSFNL